MWSQSAQEQAQLLDSGKKTTEGESRLEHSTESDSLLSLPPSNPHTQDQDCTEVPNAQLRNF